MFKIKHGKAGKKFICHVTSYIVQVYFIYMVHFNSYRTGSYKNFFHCIDESGVDNYIKVAFCPGESSNGTALSGYWSMTSS